MDITPTLLRTLGGLFELAGLFTVAIGITNLRRRFSDRPPFFKAARVAAGRIWNRIRRSKKPVTHVASVDMAAVGTVEASGRIVPGHTLTLEDKVAWLMRMVDQLQGADDGLARRIEAEKKERTQALGREQDSRQEAINEQTEDIRTLATGDLTREFWGVVAFGFGIILQVWSPEIARVL